MASTVFICSPGWYSDLLGSEAARYKVSITLWERPVVFYGSVFFEVLRASLASKYHDLHIGKTLKCSNEPYS